MAKKENRKISQKDLLIVLLAISAVLNIALSVKLYMSNRVALLNDSIKNVELVFSNCDTTKSKNESEMLEYLNNLPLLTAKTEVEDGVNKFVIGYAPVDGGWADIRYPVSDCIK